MKFSPEALKAVLDAGSVAFKRAGTSYVFTCPRCGKKDKLYMRIHTGQFICFKCREDGFRGRCEYALVELLGGTLEQYREFIYGDASGPVEFLSIELKDHFGEEESEFTMDRTFCGFDWPFNYVGHDCPAFKKGRDYLHKRGITDEIIAKYDIRFSTTENRVIFPYVIDGELVGWQGRYCGDTQRVDQGTGRVYNLPKALTTLQGDIQNHFVMFGDNLKTSDHCVLTEGPIDALKAELCGGNVAALGKGVSSSQIYWISERVSTLYIALDPDAGKEISRIAREATSLGLKVYLMVPPPGKKDFGECTYDEVYEAFLSAVELLGSSVVVSLGDFLVF